MNTLKHQTHINAEFEQEQKNKKNDKIIKADVVNIFREEKPTDHIFKLNHQTRN
jgi:hypothetical protein